MSFNQRTATNVFRDKRPKAFRQAQGYHILTFAQEHRHSSLSVVLDVRTPDEFYLRCRLLAMSQATCSKTLCRRKPTTFVVVNVQDLEEETTAPEIEFVINFPLCEQPECALWVMHRHEALLENLHQAAKDSTTKNPNFHLFAPPAEERKNSLPTPKLTPTTTPNLSPNQKMNRAAIPLQTRTQTPTRTPSETKTKTKTSSSLRNQQDSQTRDKDNAEAKIDALSKRTAIEKQRRLRKKQKQKDKKQAREIEQMHAQDFWLPRSAFVRPRLNAQRMPVNYRQKQPIPHTLLARQLQAFFTSPPSIWKGKHVWRCLMTSEDAKKE